LTCILTGIVVAVILTIGFISVLFAVQKFHSNKMTRFKVKRARDSAEPESARCRPLSARLLARWNSKKCLPPISSTEVSDTSTITEVCHAPDSSTTTEVCPAPDIIPTKKGKWLAENTLPLQHPNMPGQSSDLPPVERKKRRRRNLSPLSSPGRNTKQKSLLSPVQPPMKPEHSLFSNMFSNQIPLVSFSYSKKPDEARPDSGEEPQHVPVSDHKGRNLEKYAIGENLKEEEESNKHSQVDSTALGNSMSDPLMPKDKKTKKRRKKH
jgi:hypothetical protein